MKTQILHLESFDDRHSISDKLDWGRAERAILIWPLRGKPLSNKLDLKLIHRRCLSTGMKLALVCQDLEIKEAAQGLNIPVFRSLRKAQQVAWEYTLAEKESVEWKPERKFSRQEIKQLIDTNGHPGLNAQPAARISAVAVSFLAILALVIFMVPSAKVSFLPELETQSLQLSLSADPNIASFNLSGAVPVEIVTVSVEGRSELATTGTIGIADQPASGLIEFTNLTNQPVTVPAGTAVRTAGADAGIRFITSTEANLEGLAGATASVPIEAVNPGSGSNLPANSLVMIEGSLAMNLTATNLEPTSGGTERETAAPSLEDYDTLTTELIESLWTNALTELETSLDPQDIILYDQPHRVTITEESFTPEEAQPSSTLSLLLRVEFDVLIIRWDTFKTMGNAILDATLSENYSSQPDTLSLSSAADPVPVGDDVSTWDVVIFRKIFTSQNLAGAADAIAGKSLPQTAQILTEELALQNDPQIEISPSWWPWLPLLKSRISIIVLREGQ